MTIKIPTIKIRHTYLIYNFINGYRKMCSKFIKSSSIFPILRHWILQVPVNPHHQRISKGSSVVWLPHYGRKPAMETVVPQFCSCSLVVQSVKSHKRAAKLSLVFPVNIFRIGQRFNRKHRMITQHRTDYKNGTMIILHLLKLRTVHTISDIDFNQYLLYLW